MSTPVVVNGANYTVPAVGDKNWGQNVADLLVALAVATPGNSGYINYVAVASSPITVVSGRTYLVNTSVARTLTLPAAAANAFFHVKDVTGSAGTFNITIARAGTELIDGVAANKTLALDNGGWMLLSDGTNWYTYQDDNRRVMLANAQTITGAKTFSGIATFSVQPVLSAASNQLKIKPGANDYQITAANPAASRVYTLPDAGAAASFIMSVGNTVDVSFGVGVGPVCTTPDGLHTWRLAVDNDGNPQAVQVT